MPEVRGCWNTPDGSLGKVKAQPLTTDDGQLTTD
jgi:hypothetical protein